MNKTSLRWLNTIDGWQIPSVRVDRPEKSLICFSSQIGCNGGCPQCVCWDMPCVRNLSAEEMLASAMTDSEGVSLFSCMGVGEPFENIGDLIKVFNALPRQARLAVSTCWPTCNGLRFLRQFGVTINVVLSDKLNVENALIAASEVEATELVFSTLNPFPGCKLKPVEMPIFNEKYEFKIVHYSTDGSNEGAACGQLKPRKVANG